MKTNNKIKRFLIVLATGISIVFVPYLFGRYIFFGIIIENPQEKLLGFVNCWWYGGGCLMFMFLFILLIIYVFIYIKNGG